MAFAGWHSTITDPKGNVVPKAQVTVRDEVTGALAILYTDREGMTGRGNPFLADDQGFAAFHVVGGAYRIIARSGAYEREWRYVGIGTAQESDIDDFVTSDQLDTALSGKFDNPTGGVSQFIRGDGGLQSILGAVTQSGGAIVQMGSNANGSFVRFAGGLQICWARVTMAQNGSSTHRMTAFWDYPAEFSSPPNITVNLPMVNADQFTNITGSDSGRVSVRASGGGHQTTTATTTQVTAFFDTGTVSANSSITNVHVEAIGRWF